MALALAALTLLALCGFSLGFCCLGNLILRKLDYALASESEHVLLAIAIGLLTTEIALFLTQTTNHIRTGTLILTGVLAAIVFVEWKSVWNRLRPTLALISKQSPATKVLFIFIVAAASVEFLISQAPLTGSDAMNYHFAFQKQILANGFHPPFSNSASFLCGQQHLLILLGLALNSERLALGFIFLGGILTTLAVIHLTSRWTSPEIARAFGLLFLLTPMVFWQISASGAPDIYMAFLACVAILTLRHNQTRIWRQAVVTGFIVGGIAGSKYTGCVIAAAFLVVIVFEFRSTVFLFFFVLASAVSGVWPYLRNTVWTGDPVFPFLAPKLCPMLVTKVGMAYLVAQTGASSTHHLSQLVPFLFLAGTQEHNPGLWDFFGPTVLALAPLLLLCVRNTREWRIPLGVWAISAVGIFFASGLPRFLLPIFPIALSCVAAGWETTRKNEWRISNVCMAVLVGSVIVSGGVGLAIYSGKPILAAAGLLNRTTYLEQTAPEYRIVEAINRALGAQNTHASTLVFLRHTYYLDVPYLNGDPGGSFEIDPDALRNTPAWLDFFKKKGIGYVVRAPGYPEEIAEPLWQMERNGDLTPVETVNVQDFVGKRINQEQQTVSVAILKVKL